MWLDRSDGNSEAHRQSEWERLESCWVTDKPVNQVDLGAARLESRQWQSCVCVAECGTGLYLIISVTERKPQAPVDSHHHQTWQSGISLLFPGWSRGQMVALRVWAELRKESEGKGGRRSGEGEEEKRGVDRRGDMLRYGSGRAVSTTTTTTEDSPESSSEVRSPREVRTLKSLPLPPLFSLPALLCFANSPVFFFPSPVYPLLITTL